jgi:outer membrane protein assembly factor BamB
MEKAMVKKQHSRIFRLILLNVCLIVNACQSKSVTVTPSVAPAPTETPAPTEVPATATLSAAPGFQVRWSYQTGGAVWGAPAISDGTVFFGSDDHNLYAVEAQTGLLKWQFTTQGLVCSRPAIVDNMVYFTSDDGYLYAVRAQSGQQLWRVDIGNFSESEKRENPGTNPDPTGFDYLQSSPTAADGQIYIGSADGNAYALAADTGNINWMFKTGQKVRATPTVDGGIVYIGSWDGTVYALDALTGQARWQTPIGGQIQTTALVANDLVYTASRKASVVALDAQTGENKWEYDYGRNNWVESSPQLAGNIIYIGSSGNQYVLGLNSQTGELLTAYMDEVFFWSTPVITDNMLYIGAAAFTQNPAVGGLFCLEIPSGVSAANPIPIKLKWHLPVAETLMPDGNWAGVASSPIVVDGIIYFGGLDGKLYAVVPQP